MMGWDVSKCTQKTGQEYPGKETLEALRLLHLEKKDLVDMMAGFKRLTEGMRRKNLTYFCLSERGRYGARGQELHWSWSKFFMRKTFLRIRPPWRWIWCILHPWSCSSTVKKHMTVSRSLNLFCSHCMFCQMEKDGSSNTAESPETDVPKMNRTIRWPLVRNGNCKSPCSPSAHGRYSQWSRLSSVALSITSEPFSTQYADINR